MTTTRRIVWHCALAAGLTAGVSAAPLAAADQAQVSTSALSSADRAAIEHTGAAFVDALNTGDTAAWLALHADRTRESAGDARLGEQLGRLRQTLGHLTFHHAELTEFARGEGWSRVLHVFAKAAGDDRWKDFQIAIDTAPPFRLHQLVFIADVAEPVYLPNADLPDPNTTAWLNGYIDRLVKDERLGGALLILKGTQPIVDRTFGYVDAAATRPITSATRFSTASSSKMFTAVLVSKLVNAGRLSYDDTIGRFFPAANTPAVWNDITVGQLLSHNSGIGEYWTPAFSAARASVRTLEEFLPWIHKAGQTFAPGTSHRYSNSNFILLGLIVERVAGRPFEDELRATILNPLGMSSTSLTADTGAGSRDARPLARGTGGGGWRDADLPPHGSSAGGAMTTTADAAAFMRALGTGTLLPRATLDTLITVRNEGADASPYGYGFEMRHDSGTPSFGHGGITTGVNAELRYFPTLDVTLIMFSNQDNGAYDDLRRNVIKLIAGDR